MTETGCLWTIGHSNHSIERFLELLRLHEIEVVADVRSQPHPSSPYTKQFDQFSLRQSLKEADIGYVFLGKELGGRPPESRFYGIDRQVDYELLAQTERFQGGLDRLVTGLTQFRVAMMCSEEDPSHCHRRRLVTFELQRGRPLIEVIHIRSCGELAEESQLARKLGVPRQQGSFEDVTAGSDTQTAEQFAEELNDAVNFNEINRTREGRRNNAIRRRIDWDTCRRCGGRGHWARDCPDSPFDR